MYFLSLCVYDLKGQSLLFLSLNAHLLHPQIICTFKRENRKLLLETNKGSDQQTSQQSLLISAFDPVAAQAGLSLTWLQTPKTGFLVTEGIPEYFMVIKRIAEKTFFMSYSKGQPTDININM